MTLMRPPRTRARAAADSPRRPPGNSQREAPWPLGTGATPRAGPVSGKDCPGPAAPRAQTPDVAGPLRRRCPRLPTVSRLTGPERQVIPSRHRQRSRRPGAHSCMLSGLDIPVLCGRRSRGAATEGN